jgi:neutral trehalase
LGDAPETLNQLEALDLNCMAAKEMASLKTMADILGRKNEADEWDKRVKTLSGLINRYMWDEETGFYYHVHKDTMNFKTPAGVSLKRKEIIGFLPIWAGVASKEQAEKLLAHLTNPDEFGRKFGIPTLSAADPYYNAQVLGCCRWNGPVWITWVYPVFKGLLDYGYKDAAKDVLMKMEEAMIYQLQRNHRLWESYSPDFTQLNSPKNYIWDTLISRMIYLVRNKE